MGAPKKRRVPVAPVRDQFTRSGVSAEDVCHALGWTLTGTKVSRGRVYRRVGADTNRLRRALALAPNAKDKYAQVISAEAAAVISEVIASRGVVMCEACHEDAAGPDGLCGFCREEMEQAA